MTTKQTLGGLLASRQPTGIRDIIRDAKPKDTASRSDHGSTKSSKTLKMVIKVV